MFYFILFIGLFSTIFGAVPESIQPRIPSDGFISFMDNFLKEFQNSPSLQYVFAQAIIEARNYDAVYNTLITAAMKFQNAEPDNVAKGLADALLAVADKLTPYISAKIVALAVGETLEDRQLITTANAAKLAKLLAQSILDDQRYAEPFPAPYIKAITEGALMVVQFLNIQSPKTSEYFARRLIYRFGSLNSSV